VDIDAELAVNLALHLKQAQLEAMMSGDEYILVLPEFEVYRTRLSHGHEPNQVSTAVLGIKAALQDAKLLAEFFTHLASSTNHDQCDGVFIPKGAGYLLGPTTYEQIMRDNNFFLTTITTIPMNLEYDAWFAVIDPNQTSESEPVSLYNHLVQKPWFLCIKSVTKHKCLVVTTKPNLMEPHMWLDANLEPMVRKSIPPGIDPPTTALPRRLDKPLYSETTKTYAEILKQQFSMHTAPSSSDPTATNRPPRKRQAAIVDYDSDGSTNAPAAVVTSSMTSSNTPMSTPVTSLSPEYAAELKSLKTEIAELRTLITSAVDQFKSAIASIPMQPTTSPTDQATENNPSLTSNLSSTKAMEIEAAQSPKPEISALIHELKSDIATIAIEMREKFKEIRMPPQPIPFQLTPFPM